MTYNEYRLKAIKEIVEIITGFKLASKCRKKASAKVIFANLCINELQMDTLEIANYLNCHRSAIYQYVKIHNNKYDTRWDDLYIKCLDTYNSVIEDYNVVNEVKKNILINI